VKDALRSLTYQGFLESDGKRGAAGSTYTVAKATNIISGITLAVHSSISQNSQESPANLAKTMDGAQSALFRPIVHSKPSEESAMREAAANGDRALKRGRLRGKRDSDEKEEKDERTDGREWTKGSRPLKTSDLQEKRPNRRIDGEPLEKEKEEDLDYEYVTED
jgi:hypothetical protein